MLSAAQHIVPLHACNLARQPSTADLHGSLARQTCPADLPGRLAKQTCPADLPGRLAQQTCPEAKYQIQLKILHYCPISPCFQHIAPLHAHAWQGCAPLPCSFARQPCPAVLPGSLARQPCPSQGYIVRFGQCSVFLIPINKRRRWKLVLSLTDGALYCS
jgi:hypothetical protein